MTHPPIEAVIDSAEIAAGHDGTAELVVRLRHANGATAPVVLDEAAGLRLMAECGAAHVDELAGHSWRRVLDASLAAQRG